MSYYLNLNVTKEPWKNVFLLKGKLYIGSFEEDNYTKMFENIKTLFPDYNIEYLRFKEQILTEQNCTEDVFIRSDARLSLVCPIEICVKD